MSRPDLDSANSAERKRQMTGECCKALGTGALPGRVLNDAWRGDGRSACRARPGFVERHRTLRQGVEQAFTEMLLLQQLSRGASFKR